MTRALAQTNLHMAMNYLRKKLTQAPKMNRALLKPPLNHQKLTAPIKILKQIQKRLKLRRFSSRPARTTRTLRMMDQSRTTGQFQMKSPIHGQIQ